MWWKISWMDGRTDRGNTVYPPIPPPPVERGYNSKIFDPIRMKQMFRIELISNTALITKSLLLNRNIEKLLFESLQTNLIINFCYPFLCWHVTNVFLIDLFLLNSFFCLKTNILTIYIYIYIYMYIVMCSIVLYVLNVCKPQEYVL